LQFGIRGAGNNIAFMAENFVQARSQAGSFSAVLSGVFSALKGPAGIIVGIQALLALGPSIVSFFRDSEQEAKEFEKALKDAASGLLEFENEIAGIQIESLEQAREMVSTLEDREERLNRLSRLREKITSQDAQVLTDLDLAHEFIQDNTEAQLSLNEVARITTKLQTQTKETIDEKANAITKARKRAESMVTSREAALQVEKAYKNATEDTSEEIQTQGVNLQKVHEIQNEVIETQEDVDFSESLNIFQNVDQEFIRESLEQGIDTLYNVETALSRVKELRKNASGERLKQLNRLKDALESRKSELNSVGVEGQKAFNSIKEVQDAINNDEIETPKKAGKAISFLEDKLKNTKFESEDSREKIKRLLEILRELNGTAKKSGQELPKSFGGAFEELNGARIATEALTGAFQELGSAIGNQEPILKSFGAAAMNLLASIASQIGDILIAKGAALIASSIFGDVSAIGRGSALIGIGTALKATASAAKGVFGGGESSGGSPREDSNRRREFEGGGEGTIEGRRRGGAVGAGELYETHGLGNREFFVPNMDGAIMTQGQMRSTSQNRRREIRVTTENRLEGNINGPDMFELSTRLKNVRDFKEEFAAE
jgi:hypothetical protein